MKKACIPNNFFLGTLVRTAGLKVPQSKVLQSKGGLTSRFRRAAPEATPVFRYCGSSNNNNSISQLASNSPLNCTMTCDSSPIIIRFVLLSLISVLVTGVAFALALRKTTFPDVMATAVSALGNPRGLPSLGDLSTYTKDRVMSRQIHYVYEIIRSSSGPKVDSLRAARLAIAIVEASKKASYDPLFVAAVIRAESTFNHQAISPAGAQGLMQILPTTGKHISRTHNIEWLGDDKLHAVEYNLTLGITYLKELEKRFNGNRELALIAYNWGPANVAQAQRGEKTIPSMSKSYAQGVLGAHKRWSTDLLSRAEVQAQAINSAQT